MDGLFLGLDVGTQGTKALLIDAAAAAVVARGEAHYGLIAGLGPGHAEQHPHTWIEAVRTAAAEALRGFDAGRVQGIGVSGQQHGCVVLDEHGCVVRPAKLWCDTSTAPEARALSARLGRAVPTGFTASKLLWLRQREPLRWRCVRTVLLPHDYVNLVLCGNACMEAGDASGTGFFDPAARAFDRAAMAAIDEQLDRLLPELVGAGDPAGRLSAEGAQLLGLRQGLLVSAGGGDNMMSAIGSGATRSGVVTLSLGTSATLFARSERPVLDPDGLIAPFCSSDGAFLPLLCVMNCTGLLEEVKAAFGMDHGLLTAAAAAVPPGSDGLLWLPFLQGERVPDLPEATGTLLGLRPGLLRAGHLYRAAMEGVALNLAWGADRLRALGLHIERVHAVGGAARNGLWLAILADCLGVPVQPLLETESAALGAAIQALWTVRRQREPGLSCDAVARPFVHPAGEAAVPDPGRTRSYRELGRGFRGEVARLWQIPAGE
jgi:D-xylulose kinase